MKKILLAAIAIIGISFSAQAQPPTVSTAPPTGDYTVTDITAPGVWATRLDTLIDAGVDTFKAKVGGWRNSVAFSVECLKISGDHSGVLVQLWASDRNSKYKGYYLVKTDTLQNTAQLQLLNYTFTGNSHTDYWYTFRGAGTHKFSFRSYVTPK